MNKRRRRALNNLARAQRAFADTFDRDDGRRTDAVWEAMGDLQHASAVLLDVFEVPDPR